MKKFDTAAFLKELKSNEFTKHCGIPLGYKAGYPVVGKKNDAVLITVPFNRVVKSKKPGESVVFPYEYAVSFELHAVTQVPESFKKFAKKEEGYSGASPAGFKVFKFCGSFSKIPFDKPVDTFPNKELRAMGEEEYKEKVAKVYTAYDAIINDLLGIEPAAGVDKVEFKQLLGELLGPVTKQLYKFIDADFFNTYLA